MFARKVFAKKNFKSFILSLLFTGFVLGTALATISCKSTDVKEKGTKAENAGTPLTFDSAVVRGSLENGMDYFVLHNEEPKNRIVLRLVVKAGSCIEEDDQQGVAHFIEHLAFNGTEHFEKSAIVDYFEKIGMNFGADLNAYTSFEETVYKLEIPADDPSMLQQALLILHDWACAVTFPAEEIEKERGVVNEEWRLRQGLQGRISDKQIHFLLKDSMFENRLPIGQMEIVNTISRERILDFYHKWYRPDLMSIIVVGDADTSLLETQIKEIMGAIPKNNSKLSIPEFPIPQQKEKQILRISDPEQKYTLINIFERNPTPPRKTEETSRSVLVQEIASSIFDQRLSEITNTVDAPWIAAGVGDTPITNFASFYYLGFIPKDGMFVQAVKTFFDEYDRFMLHGITQSELERFKQYYTTQMELYHTNKDKTPSADLADNLIQYVLLGKTYLSNDDFYNLYMKLIPQITVEEVNACTKNMIKDRGTQFLILSQDTASDIPNDDEIMQLWKDYKSEELIAYTDDVEDSELMERPAKKGKVTSKKEIAELGVNEYILDNGIRIITKKTDFEANTVYMKLTSKGGLFYLDEKDVPSARLSLNYAITSGLNGMSYNQLIKKITSKQVSLNFNIHNTTEAFSGNASWEDTEALLQLVNLMFTKTQFNDEGWQIVRSNAETMAKNHGLQPNDLFQDKIREILYGNSIFWAPFDMALLKKMNPESAEKIYHERFANPADFTYIFVGDFDEEALIDLCCWYFGSLETSANREETFYKYWDFPKGKPSATVKKGLDNQGQVYMSFGGKLPPSTGLEEGFYEDDIMNQLEALFDIKLREVIREDKSGSYGIGVNGYIDGYPERYYRFIVNFGCEPEREQELADTVIEVIKDVQKNGVSEDYIQKLQETNRRSFEVNKRDNNWWISRLEYELALTYEPLWVSYDVDKRTNWITAEALQAAAKKYLNTDNYVTVFLKPEK